MSDHLVVKAGEAVVLPTPDSATVRGRIDAMNMQQIELRRNEILNAAAGDYERLSTEQLHELAYIASRLRKTNVGPPKEPKTARAKVPKTIADLF